MIMQDQATELRRLMAQDMRDNNQSPARVIAVTSGKGGVGKTNVSVNLAARLSTMGRHVLLLDADLGLANADVICNVTSRANLAHVVAGRMELERAIVHTPCGFDLIPGASGLLKMAALNELERARIVSMLKSLDHQYDLILIDTGAGISQSVMTFLNAADELLVVTTPEPTAITDAYALIKVVSRQSESMNISLLVNMVKDKIEARRVFDRINAVSRRFLGISLADAGHVPLDHRVPLAVRQRMPFVLDKTESPASLSVAQLAHKMDRHAVEPHNGSFFQRMAAWLAG